MKNTNPLKHFKIKNGVVRSGDYTYTQDSPMSYVYTLISLLDKLIVSGENHLTCYGVGMGYTAAKLAWWLSFRKSAATKVHLIDFLDWRKHAKAAFPSVSTWFIQSAENHTPVKNGISFIDIFTDDNVVSPFIYEPGGLLERCISSSSLVLMNLCQSLEKTEVMKTLSRINAQGIFQEEFVYSNFTPNTTGPDIEYPFTCSSRRNTLGIFSKTEFRDRDGATGLRKIVHKFGKAEVFGIEKGRIYGSDYQSSAILDKNNCKFVKENLL